MIQDSEPIRYVSLLNKDWFNPAKAIHTPLNRACPKAYAWVYGAMGRHRPRYIHAWVIQTIEREEYLPGFPKVHLYSGTRRAPRSKYHWTPSHYRTRLFTSKRAAEKYFYLKIRHGVKMENAKISRRKIFLDRDGSFDYRKMIRHFR